MSEKAGKENVNTYVGQNKTNYINNHDNINTDYSKKKCYFKYMNDNEDYISDNDNNLGNFTNFLNRLNNVNFEDLDIKTDSSNEFSENFNNELYSDQMIYHTLDNKNYEYISSTNTNSQNDKYDEISNHLNENHTNSFQNHSDLNKKYKKNSDYSNDTKFSKFDSTSNEIYEKNLNYFEYGNSYDNTYDNTYNNEYDNSFGNSCDNSFDNESNLDEISDSEHSNHTNSLSVLRKLASKNITLFDTHLSSKNFIPPQNDFATALKHLKTLAAIEYNRIIKNEKGKTQYTKPKIKNKKLEIKQQIPDLKNVRSFNDFAEDIFIYDKQTKMYKCPENDCFKEFPNLSRCRRHYITHTNIKPFKCENPACNRIFSRKDNMLQHLRVHCPYTKK